MSSPTPPCCSLGHTINANCNDCPNIEDHESLELRSQAEFYNATVKLSKNPYEHATWIIGEDLSFIWNCITKREKKDRKFLPGINILGIGGLHITVDDGLSLDIELYVIYKELPADFNIEDTEPIMVKLHEHFDSIVGNEFQQRLASRMV